MLRALGLRPAWCSSVSVSAADTLRQWTRRMSSRKLADAWAGVEADAVYFAASKSGRRRAMRMREADQRKGKEKPRAAYRQVRRAGLDTVR